MDEQAARESRADDSGNAEQRARVREILHRSLELPAAERGRYLDQACGSDAELRAEVESLIQPALAEALATATMAGYAAAPPLKSGQKISHYEIIGKIGEGGMGAVYKAIDTNLSRTVALKVISRADISADHKRRFAREARAASALNHPNIVTIYEYNSEAGTDFIAMEYVEGTALDRLLATREAPQATLLDYARQVGSALAKAHAAGIVHRDLKPANIMVTADGVAKVLDFGLAKQESLSGAPDGLTNTVALTQVGVALGTPAYMSPEQAMGEPADFRADIFSFGIILYEIACGQRPFHGANAQATVRQIAFKDPEPPGEVNPALPAGLCSLIDQCLRKNRDERLQSIADVAPVLSASMTSMTAGSMVPARRALGILPGRRKFISAGLLAAAVLGALALLGIPVVREKIRAASTTAALPKSSQEWYADGQAYIARLDRKGNNVKAVEAFQKAIEGNPQNAAAYAGLAEAQLDRGQASPDQQLTNLAMEAARKAVELNPYLAAAHAALGASLIRAGRVDEAMRSIDQALALDPKSGMAHAYRAAAFEKKGDLHSAEGEYRQAVSLAPSVWSFRSSLAIVLSRLGRYPEAIDSFQGALQLTPDNGPVLANLGAAYHFAGKDEDAAAAFQRSLEVLPSARGFSNLGTLLFYLGRHADAAKAFEKAVSIDANPYVYWGNLGDAYRWTPGAREKSLEAYRQAIQLVRKQIQSSPKDAALRSSLATYLARSGKQEDALAEVAAIGGDGLKNPAVQFKIGLVYEIGHDRTRALDSLERALAAGYANKEVENEPELIELRRDARYHRLAAKYTKK